MPVPSKDTVSNYLLSELFQMALLEYIELVLLIVGSN